VAAPDPKQTLKIRKGLKIEVETGISTQKAFMCPKKNLKNFTSKELLFMANGITRYYLQPEVVQLIFGRPLSVRKLLVFGLTTIL
jgi:hypothetical protein